MYDPLKLKQIKAQGWVRAFLQTQASGMTGHMDEIGNPFVNKYWEGEKNLTVSEDENFLGGLNSVDDAWTPFEQNAYWIDGMLRAGYLIDDAFLIEKAQAKIYPALENADEDGYIGPAFLKDGMLWAHSVYFRALVAEYEATGDKRILEALQKHYLRKPVTDAIGRADMRIIAVRDIAAIETALYLYGETQNGRFLQIAEEAYDKWNDVFSDDRQAPPEAKMRDLTLKGMLSNKRVCNNHGVTYNEICKLAAILHLHTGKEIYKTAAIKAFDKLYRDQMLVDGVHSSTEYLNGNADSHAGHETCDVSDFTWAIGYLFMITGDSKYADWVEDAIFNGGLGSVDDDFKGNQYFSCPNQVIANDTSNHHYFFRGKDWTSYAPKKFLACCAGNVHRFMPNFVARSWMRQGNILVPFVYAPTRVNFQIGGGQVAIEEVTNYPFEPVVRFQIDAEKPVKFSLKLRRPEWAEEATVTVNGEKIDKRFVKGYMLLTRTFAAGDEVVISFVETTSTFEKSGGIAVKRGALLYALPVAEKKVVEGYRELDNKSFPHYSLYADGAWNYGLKKSELCPREGKSERGSKPWQSGKSGLFLEVKGYKIADFKTARVKYAYSRMKARGAGVRTLIDAVFTPKVKQSYRKVSKTPETLRLVPYCTTRLRIAIFPALD